MGRGERVATKLRDEYCLSKEITLEILENVCFDKDAFIKYKPINGAQGRILFSNSSDKSIITINSNIFYEPKKKFVLAHELGHNVLHKKVMNFICTEKDLNEWESKKRYESEANEFAAEFLMPTNELKKRAKNQSLDANLFIGLAESFGTSITSTSIRYPKKGTIPCYIISSTDGKIDWISRSDDYYLGNIYRGKELPRGCNAYKYFEKGEKNKKTICLATDWFEENEKRDLYLFEDCIYFDSYSSVLTILWECTDYN